MKIKDSRPDTKLTLVNSLCLTSNSLLEHSLIKHKSNGDPPHSTFLLLMKILNSIRPTYCDKIAHKSDPVKIRVTLTTHIFNNSGALTEEVIFYCNKDLPISWPHHSHESKFTTRGLTPLLMDDPRSLFSFYQSSRQ